LMLGEVETSESGPWRTCEPTSLVSALEVRADESQVGLLASFFARWSRDPAAKLCLRRATLILRAQYAPKLSLARGSDSARRPAWGPQLASFLWLSPPKLRLHRFCPRRGESGSLFCGL